jgi:hypothetical protein
MIPELVVPPGVWRGTGAETGRGRVAFGDSPATRRGVGPGGTRTDRRVFVGLVSRRTRGSRGPRLTRRAIIPARHAIATSAGTRQSNKTPRIPAVPLFAVDVAAAGAGVEAAGIETTGVGVLCSGVPSTAAGAPRSAPHAHSNCNESCRGNVHPNGVRMLHFPGQVEAVRRSGYYRIQSVPIFGFGLACPQHDARWRHVAIHVLVMRGHQQDRFTAQGPNVRTAL